MRITLVLAALLLVGAAPAIAQTAAPVVVAQIKPRSMNDCEQVKGDLAYNQCLAMFGPAAHTKGASSGDGGASAGPSAAASAAAVAADEPATRPTRGRRGRVHVRRGGRQSATFSVGRHGGSHGRRGRRHR